MTRERSATGRLVAGLLLLLSPCGGCRDETAPESAAPSAPPLPVERLSVYVVSYPLAYFAQRIGGEAVEVTFPAPPAVDPAFWTPDAETIRRFQGADLILLNGAGYARWVESAALPGSRRVDTSQPIVDLLIRLAQPVTHSHGRTGEHSHHGYATHVWLDPELAVAQSEVIAAALQQARLDAEDVFRSGLSALLEDLRHLDGRLAAVAQRIGEEPLLFSHPLYQYLIRRFDLHSRSLHWEPAESPSPAMWERLDTLLGEHPARLMIWEAEPLATTVRELETRGIRSVVFDPCARRPAQGDFLSVMLANVERLGAAFPEE